MASRRRRKSGKNNWRVHCYSVEVPYPVEMVAKLREEAINEGKSFIILDGDSINIRSLRLDTFFDLGFKCVECGIEGTHFIKEKSHKIEPYHINLYATDEDGKEVLMTKDHIIPASQGGLDIPENMQPMCSRCNSKKGNKMPEKVDPVLLALGKYLKREEMRQDAFVECLI